MLVAVPFDSADQLSGLLGSQRTVHAAEVGAGIGGDCWSLGATAVRGLERPSDPGFASVV
jgi:hypothetical protein